MIYVPFKSFTGTAKERESAHKVYETLHNEVISAIDLSQCLATINSDHLQLYRAIEEIRLKSPASYTLTFDSKEPPTEGQRIEKFLDGVVLHPGRYCFTSFRILLNDYNSYSNDTTVSQDTINLTFQRKTGVWSQNQKTTGTFSYTIDPSDLDYGRYFFRISPTGAISVLTPKAGYFCSSKLIFSHFQFVRYP